MALADYPEKLVCVTGVGQSEVARPSKKHPLALTVDACREAIAAAGLTVADIDGIATYPGQVATGDGQSPVGATETKLALGMKPNWVHASTEGHAHMGPIFSAIMAIASGMCRHVVVFRTIAQASARAEVHHAAIIGGGRSTERRAWGNYSWMVPYHALNAAVLFGLYAQGYFRKYGATSRQLGAIAVNSRKMASLNPKALYRQPITIDDYLASRMICEPLRLYDCDPHADGSTAILLSRKDVAKDLRLPPLHIEAMGMGLGGFGVCFHDGDFSEMPADKAAQMLWSRTDIKPKDLDFAQLYDGYSIIALLWMEALGLVGRGEAASFVEGGSRIALDGELPLNTSGGQLSAGRLHGYGHIHESCVQLWGMGGARQVPGAEVGVVTNGGFGYGALLLRR